MGDVIKTNFEQHNTASDKLYKSLHEAVLSATDDMNLSTIIGILEMVKADVLDATVKGR